MFQYFLSVVPTTYRRIDGIATKSYQYAIMEHERSARFKARGLTPPGIVFGYKFSPIAVDVAESRGGLLQLGTRLCAVLGGLFTVAGMANGLVGRVVPAKKVVERGGGGGSGGGGAGPW